MAIYNTTNSLHNFVNNLTINTNTTDLTREQIRQYEELMNNFSPPNHQQTNIDLWDIYTREIMQRTQLNPRMYDMPYYSPVEPETDTPPRFGNHPGRISNIFLTSNLEAIRQEIYAATGAPTHVINLRIMPLVSFTYGTSKSPGEYKYVELQAIGTQLRTGRGGVFDLVMKNRIGMIAADGIVKIDVRSASQHTIRSPDPAQMVYWTPGISRSIEPPMPGPIFGRTSGSRPGFLENLRGVVPYSVWMLVDDLLGREMKNKLYGAMIFSFEGVSYPNFPRENEPRDGPIELNPTFQVCWEKGSAFVTVISSFHSAPLFTHVLGSTSITNKVYRVCQIGDRTPILQIMEEFLDRAAIAAQTKAAKVLKQRELISSKTGTIEVRNKVLAAVDKEKRSGNSTGTSLELLGTTFHRGKKRQLRANIGILLADRLVTKTKVRIKDFSLFHKVDRSLLTYTGDTVAWIRNPGLYVYKFMIPKYSTLFSGRQRRKKILWYFRYLNLFLRIDEAAQRVYILGSDESYPFGEVITVPNILVRGILSESVKEAIQDCRTKPQTELSLL